MAIIIIPGIFFLIFCLYIWEKENNKKIKILEKKYQKKIKKTKKGKKSSSIDLPNPLMLLLYVFVAAWLFSFIQMLEVFFYKIGPLGIFFLLLLIMTSQKEENR